MSKNKLISIIFVILGIVGMYYTLIPIKGVDSRLELTSEITFLEKNSVFVSNEGFLTAVSISPTNPQVLGVSNDRSEWDDIISKHFPKREVDTAIKIMNCESGGNPKAHNLNHRTKDNSWGLFQINLYGKLAQERPLAEWLKVPENNVMYARKIWDKQGWKRGWANCYKVVLGLQ